MHSSFHLELLAKSSQTLYGLKTTQHSVSMQCSDCDKYMPALKIFNSNVWWPKCNPNYQRPVRVETPNFNHMSHTPHALVYWWSTPNLRSLDDTSFSYLTVLDNKCEAYQKHNESLSRGIWNASGCQVSKRRHIKRHFLFWQRYKISSNCFNDRLRWVSIFGMFLFYKVSLVVSINPRSSASTEYHCNGSINVSNVFYFWPRDFPGFPFFCPTRRLIKINLQSCILVTGLAKWRGEIEMLWFSRNFIYVREEPYPPKSIKGHRKRSHFFMEGKICL